jgi:hypothetical protein
MKSRLILAASSAFLLVVAGTANSQQTQQESQPCGQAILQQGANVSAQPSKDTSYGGLPENRSATSSPLTERCLTRPQCDVLYGP